jgi:peptide/nickel transport system permease protein
MSGRERRNDRSDGDEGATGDLGLGLSVEANDDERSLFERVADDPRPAAVWAVGIFALVAVEFGALASGLTDPVPWDVLYVEPTKWAVGENATRNATIAIAQGPQQVAAASPEVSMAVSTIRTLAVVVAVSATIAGAVALAQAALRADGRAGAVGGLLALTAVGVAVSRGAPLSTAATGVFLIGGLALLGVGVSRGRGPTVAVGAVVTLVGLVGLNGVVGGFPTLLTRELIPNQGYQVPGEGWQGTFLGLSPAVAWAIRFSLVYVYAAVFLWWCWRGYRTFRRHYRVADWTPRDDIVDRFSTHYWGLFGLFVVFAFVVFALFAPTVGPATMDANLANPYSNYINYYDGQAGEVANVTVGQANLGASSAGNPDRNVGPMQYDEFGRFHPFGTLVSGKDLFVFMAGGARVSLFIGIVSIGIGGGIALALALVTAYYKGLADLIVVVTSDAVQSLPRLLLVILLSVVFANHWLSTVYSGGLLLALIFAATSWPFLWRAVRGPAFQVSEEEWIDAARSFGQRPATTMRKHMAPYILGYMLVYGSLTLGGVIIATAALSFLGLGVSPPTPEWGRAVNLGRSYIATVSWHISTIPGLLVVFVVTGFNAFGDGIRDAIDPQSAGGGGDATDEAAAAGGGG